MADQERQLLLKGISAAKEGRRKEALSLLKQVLKINPRNVSAWLWIGAITDDDRVREYCAQKVLEIEPFNEQAIKMLDFAKRHQSAPSQVSKDLSTGPVNKDFSSRLAVKEQYSGRHIPMPQKSIHIPQHEAQTALFLLLAGLGTLALIIGFFSPWLIIDFGSFASVVGGMLSGAFGAPQVDLSNLLRMEMNGWDMATGITIGDMIGKFGPLLSNPLVSGVDASVAQQRVWPPMPSYFFLPLISVTLLVMGIYKNPKMNFLVFGGGISLLLGAVGAFLVNMVTLRAWEYGMQWLSEQDYVLGLIASLIQVKMGNGIWLVLVGGILWFISALIKRNEIASYLPTNKWALSSVIIGFTSLFLAIPIGSAIAIALGWVGTMKDSKHLFAQRVGISVSVMSLLFSLGFSLISAVYVVQILEPILRQP